ncbi:transcription elongation factor GreA [Dehalococcoidia bacterium]|nr:transcription elongation factor GreA [Dehalococcoidia bacterium]
MPRRQTLLTPEGLRKLILELESLRASGRQEIAQRIQRAKELGGSVDNAEYDEAKNEQAFVEGRILTLETMTKNAVLIPDDRPHSELVEVGSAVTIVKGSGNSEQYVIVGSSEADPAQGRISNESPVGKALLGHRVGEETEVATPSGVIKFSITKVE